ncbi:hypothetical protein HDV00_008741 [Rhizophlyctis rosea]|nr:hypothetical protein HDV00_008741 [Rhizophlyctis rosea]
MKVPFVHLLVPALLAITHNILAVPVPALTNRGLEIANIPTTPAAIPGIVTFGQNCCGVTTIAGIFVSGITAPRGDCIDCSSTASKVVPPPALATRDLVVPKIPDVPTPPAVASAIDTSCCCGFALADVLARRGDCLVDCSTVVCKTLAKIPPVNIPTPPAVKSAISSVDTSAQDCCCGFALADVLARRGDCSVDCSEVVCKTVVIPKPPAGLPAKLHEDVVAAHDKIAKDPRIVDPSKYIPTGKDW